MSTKGLGELGPLTSCERLLIYRRRRGETQHQAASRLGITRDVYSSWERTKRANTHPPLKIGRLHTHERCLLYRRRVGKSQQQVANSLGCCRYWVNQMERGKVPCHMLVCYWEQ